MKLVCDAPATVANLGPGFDSLALAVDLVDRFELDTATEPAVAVDGEGADELPADATNLVFRSLAYLAREVGIAPPAFRLSCTNAIPLQRGLGSSAAAVVGGLLLGNALLGAGLSDEELLSVAIDVEGHPDNVAACLEGGLAIAYLSNGGWRAERLSAHPDLRPALVVPLAERVATQDARRVLPHQVPHADAAFTAGRAALAVVALTTRPDLLAEALEDRLHQPYRLPLAPGARALFADLREAGLPSCLAGSGPTLLVFEDDDHRVPELGPGWRILRPPIRATGATVRPG